MSHGAGDDHFGVKMGDLRVIAKKIESDHGLAMALWKSGNADARLLATLILKVKSLSVIVWTKWCATRSSRSWPSG